MERGVEQIQEFIDQYEKIVQGRKVFDLGLSEADKEISRLYHLLEFSDDPCEGDCEKFIGKLKNALKLRREMKAEIMIRTGFEQNMAAAIDILKKQHPVRVEKQQAFLQGV